MLDARDPDYRLIAQYEAARVTPPIPLGTRGALGGRAWEVIGYLVRRTVGDDPATWFEYLLHNPLHGVRWLVEYHGHWVLTTAAAGLPAVAGLQAEYLGDRYRHFQTSAAAVTAAVGEFPWTVRVGERVEVSDYVRPPRILSREAGAQETTWSVGEYVDGRAVWKAFALPDAPPERIGVGAAEPSPYTPRAATMFWLMVGFLGAVLLIHLLFSVIAQRRLVLDLTGAYRPGAVGASMVVSDPFPIDGRRSNVMVEVSSTVANSWAYFNLALVNDVTGVAKTFGREVSLYSGRDSDGTYWSEGANWDRAWLPSVPAGTYVLVVEPEGPAAVVWRVRLTRDVPRSLWFWLAAVAMLVQPLWFWFRSVSFESRRWQESDHSTTSSRSKDDD